MSMAIMTIVVLFSLKPGVSVLATRRKTSRAAERKKLLIKDDEHQ